MRTGDLEREDVATVRTPVEALDPDPSRAVLEAAEAGRGDALGLARDAGQDAGPVALGHERDSALDLVGAADANPVRVLRRLGRAPPSPRRDDADVREKPEDALGELVADRPELDDAARTAVDERPRPVALEDAGQQRPLVGLSTLPDEVRE